MRRATSVIWRSARDSIWAAALDAIRATISATPIAHPEDVAQAAERRLDLAEGDRQPGRARVHRPAAAAAPPRT